MFDLYVKEETNSSMQTPQTATWYIYIYKEIYSYCRLSCIE